MFERVDLVSDLANSFRLQISEFHYKNVNIRVTSIQLSFGRIYEPSDIR